MIPDLQTCEWSHPGSNRSLVDPVVAVARLEMPAPTRAVLVEKMRRHQFDDVVRIDWASIRSENGADQYEAVIRNMNFGSGSICKTMTRNTWKADHVESAIVYLVDGRAFGFASVCGNLFEITRTEDAAPPAETNLPVGTAGPVYPSVFVPPPVLQSPELPSSVVSMPRMPDVVADRFPLIPPLVAFGVPLTVSAVPEPSSWLLLIAGALLMWLVLRLRR